MDKFGIFNLLNSFFDFSSKTFKDNSQSSEQNPEHSSPASNTLESLLSAFSNSNKPSPQTSQDVNPERAKKPKPLQSQMLSTMNNHQQFVDRVVNSTTTKSYNQSNPQKLK